MPLDKALAAKAAKAEKDLKLLAKIIEDLNIDIHIFHHL